MAPDSNSASRVASLLSPKPAVRLATALLTGEFRALMRYFQGSGCPMCLALRSREREAVESIRSRSRPDFALCGAHHERTSREIAEPSERARITRLVLESILAKDADCSVCKKLFEIEARLVAVIRCLDHRIRFQKALEAAPLFCRRHSGLIAQARPVSAFARIQRMKLARLRDELAQAELRGRAELDWLLHTTSAFLSGTDQPEPACSDADELSESEKAQLVRELERWDEKRRRERLAVLESEVASLRYRNYLLAEENRRLKLVCAARGSEAASGTDTDSAAAGEVGESKSPSGLPGQK